MRSANTAVLMVIAGTAALALAGCGTPSASPDPAATTSAGGVERVEVPAATPTPAAAPAAAVLQSQPGPAGAVAALNKVAVTGDVLTVQLTVTGSKGVLTLPLDQINLIDDKTSQRIGMLKDNDGRWLASPISGNNADLNVNLYDSPQIVWMKFPAPPATSPTVSLNLPQIAPFDGVPVTR